MDKIRVVWLCHLDNAEIQNIVKPYKKKGEKAPWIFKSLHILEGDSRFELFVIAPYEYITGIRHFDLRGIHYAFFNPYIPFWGRHWPRFFKWDYISNFAKSKRIVKRLVKKIQPDIIHLQGAENPYYSSAVLPLINKYPTILTIQGFYSHSRGEKTGNTLKRVRIEQEIISKIPIAFYRTKKMAKDIKTFNPEVRLFWNMYGSLVIQPPKIRPELKYDICFFTRVCKNKGIEDLLQAVSVLKRQKPSISLCVIGSGNIALFKQMATDLGISENVYWAGFLPTQKDVHILALQAKVSVLPTYFDIIPGTIIESMFLGIPVVSYNTDSIPEVNEKGEVISLVERGNIEALAQEINRLLDDEKLRKERSIKAKERAYEMFDFDDEEIKVSLLKGYKAAIETYNRKHVE